jgi:hypothetical protein
MSSDENDYFYIKVVDLDDIDNFLVLSFFIRRRQSAQKVI